MSRGFDLQAFEANKKQELEDFEADRLAAIKTAERVMGRSIKAVPVGQAAVSQEAEVMPIETVEITE